MTGPQARSRDRIGVPWWAPITEALAISKGRCCSGGNLLPLPWRICFERSKDRIHSDILWSGLALPGLYNTIGYG